MPHATYKRQGWKTPIELRAHRGGLIMFGVLSLALLLVGRAELPFMDKVRMTAADLASDVLGAGAAVSDAVSGAIDYVSNAADLYDENERLRRENTELLAWREKALEQERQIAAFEGVMEILYTPIEGITAASVIADTGGPFSRALIVNAGANKDVREGDAALDRFGLVGRVVKVGARSARILLLTDSASHIPVVIGESGGRAILSGDSDGLSEIRFIPPGATLREGEQIVTSGDGGVLPPGLPVGVVHLRGAEPPSATLYADAGRIEVVAIKRFNVINDVDVPPPVAEAPPESTDETVAANPQPAGR
mgnify:FL=1